MLKKDRVHGYIQSKFQGPILEGPISITLACKKRLMIPSLLQDLETAGVRWLTFWLEVDNRDANQLAQASENI